MTLGNIWGILNVDMKRYRTIDLFAGIGGVRLGFERTGRFETVFANDFDKYCKITYQNNFRTPDILIKDLNEVSFDEIPEFDFLLGGFPCQPFSVAGYRQGFDDRRGRGNLFFRIAEILEAKKPAGFLLENVKNLKTHDNGKTFNIIIDTLENKLGYFTKTGMLNTKDFGNTPQNRERVYIVGFLNKKHRDNFDFPKSIALTKTINDLLDSNVDKKYFYNDKPLYKKLVKDVIKEGVIYQWRRKYVRENRNGVCPTLTANMGMGGHNVPIVKQGNVIRKLTPKECLRFQGYDDSFVLPLDKLADSRLYKQIGNSVSVSVIERIAKKIYEAME